MNGIDLSFIDLAILYALLLIPLAISFFLGLGIIRSSLLAVLRMSIQLLFMGFYMDVIFKFNSALLNVAWIMIMLLVANASILRQSKLSWRRMFPFTFLGIAAGFSVVLTLFITLVIRPVPLYDARYLIPISGMLLGNCMRGNVVALERFYSAIRRNEKEFITYQLLGATLTEALRPYLKAALRAATGPHIATMATLGIVALPGMMTGQILGGASPMTAIKYQLAIMIGIFCAMLASSLLSILFTVKRAFDNCNMLRQDIFSDQNQ